jgi:hypothetical protein
MMALADYRLCDVCGGKCFYDAHLNYDIGASEYRAVDKPFRLAGQEQYDSPEMNQTHGMRLDYVGDWAVICTDCAETHETKIVPRAANPSQQEQGGGNG